MPVYALLAFGALMTGAAFAVLVFLFGRRSVATHPEADWLRTFSATRYQPMLRMLAEDDYRWLAAQGIGNADIRRLRRERRRIFATYLKNLVRDFERLHLTARTLLLAERDDQAQLAERLVSVQLHFHRSVMRVRVQLFLYDLGFRNVDVSSLVAGIESMQRSVNLLLPSPQTYYAR